MRFPLDEYNKLKNFYEMLTVDYPEVSNHTRGCEILEIIRKCAMQDVQQHRHEEILRKMYADILYVLRDFPFDRKKIIYAYWFIRDMATLSFDRQEFVVEMQCRGLLE